MFQTATGAFNQLDIPPEAIVAYREGRAAMGQQQYSEAITHYSQALSFPTAPALFQGRVLEQRGECHWLLGHYDDAACDFQMALDISDDREQQARARARLGDVADSRGDYAAAAAYYRQALKEGMAVGDVISIGRAHRGLGIVDRRQGRTEQAITHLTQALAAFRQAGDAREQARVLTSIGITRQAQGEYQQAIAANAEALSIMEALKDRWRAALLLNSIGECHQALYDLEMALQYHERAFKLAEIYGAAIILPDIQRNLGLDLVEWGRVDEGVVYLEQALAGARRLAKHEQEALTLFYLARAYLAQENVSLAATSAHELSTLAENLGADRFRALAAFVRGELLFAQGQRAEAIAELNVAMLDAQASLDRGMLWRLHATMGHVVDDPAIAAVHMQIAADFIRQTVEPLQDVRLKSSFLNAAPVTAVLIAAGADPAKM
jgi:tetratricopeptide (TPR) repeat protein